MIDIQDKDPRNNGRWTKVEHEKFLLGLQLFGKNWKKIQQLVGSRTGAQIRSHAQKFFLKSKSPSEGQSQEQGQQESYQFRKPVSVISKEFSESEEIQSQYSYFMSKIVKMTNRTKFDSSFSFWQQFIDIGKSANQKVQQQGQYQGNEQIKRKDSFVIFDLCNDSKQETTLSNLSMLGEPIL